jgi:hypothetical protein
MRNQTAKIKIRGSIGSPFATSEKYGSRPVVQDLYVIKGHSFTPHYIDADFDWDHPPKRYEVFVEQLKTGGIAYLSRAIRPDANSRTTKHKKWIAAYKVANIAVIDGKLHLDLVDRLEDAI